MQNIDREQSPETFNALVDAVTAHVRAISPEFPLLTDWVLSAASVGSEMDVTQYTHSHSSSPFHSLVGLSAMGGEALEAQRFEDLDD